MNTIIHSEKEYESAKQELDQLLDLDLEPSSDEGRRLQVLALLIDEYEKQAIRSFSSSPIDAIKFRMDQLGMRQKDLVPFIGTKGRVSDILSGRRTLTLSMIRSLHEGLKIPLESLVQDGQRANSNVLESVEDFPVTEMLRRNWFSLGAERTDESLRLAVQEFLRPLSEFTFGSLMRSSNLRLGKKVDQPSLTAWTAQVVRKAYKVSDSVCYDPDRLTSETLANLIRLSCHSTGPLQAQHALRDLGVILVTERHLPKTYLDGALIMASGQNPIIGLTLRYDRIDNFWFTLMHELGHLILHARNDVVFYDDLDENPTDSLEKEADDFATEVLVPTTSWLMSPAKYLMSEESARELADRLNIHVAIVAGKMRRESNSYHLLTHLVGHNTVRDLFETAD